MWPSVCRPSRRTPFIVTNEVRAFLMLAVLVCALPELAQEPPVDPQQLIREGIALFDAGRYDEAIAKYKAALAVDPKNSTAAYELGMTYGQKGDFPACGATLEPLGAVAGPNQLAALIMLGNCLDSGGQRKKAIETYQKALKVAPDDPRVEYELGIVYMAEGRFDEARETLKKDVIARPGHLNGRYSLAMTFETQNFRVPALMELLHYLALDPSSPRAAEAATHARALLDLGVEQKDEKNITLTVDPKARTEEGDYNTFSVELALASGVRFTEEKEKRSEFERVQGQLITVLQMLLEMPSENQRDYTWRVNRPFFQAMEKAKVTEPFAAAALSTLRLEGTKEWLEKNSDAIRNFVTWMKPQAAAKPAAELPVPPK
jgi:tetratricopeptide (TPR) repeat protein